MEKSDEESLEEWSFMPELHARVEQHAAPRPRTTALLWLLRDYEAESSELRPIPSLDPLPASSPAILRQNEVPVTLPAL